MSVTEVGDSAGSARWMRSTIAGTSVRDGTSAFTMRLIVDRDPPFTYGTKISGGASVARPEPRTDPTTPTIVSHGFCEFASPRLIRRPIAVWPKRYWRTNASFTIATLAGLKAC